jgi:cytosolic 5'-nucleotidase 3
MIINKMENVIISNKDNFEKKKDSFKEAGPNKIHVLSDFDGTLTKAFVNSRKIPSIISILRDESYLTEDYPDKAKQLFEKYHPIEADNNIGIVEKKKLMEEWWRSHFKLLIKSGFNRGDIEKAVKSKNLQLRDESSKLIEILDENNVPMVIISSSGIGEESVSLYMKNKGIMRDNIKIVSNRFEWDENGYAVGVKESIIHSFNKDETLLKEFDFYNEIKGRKNVILLGNTLGDLGMIKGFDYKNLITIGYLNEDINKQLDSFKKSYDVVIINDGSMKFVNDLLKDILK